jgi:UDP-N-acetylglucosamine transferase subunit ALG13
VILATVGTQLPFPRLIRALDELAPSLGSRVVAQTGDYPAPLRNIEHHVSMDPRKFDILFSEAHVVVAHAGIGTVLAAQKHAKPLIIFPRRAALNEHRNDHQLATAQQLSSRPGIYVAWDEGDLATLLKRDDLSPANRQVSPGLAQIRTAIRGFILGAEA